MTDQCVLRSLELYEKDHSEFTAYEKHIDELFTRSKQLKKKYIFSKFGQIIEVYVHHCTYVLWRKKIDMVYKRHILHFFLLSFIWLWNVGWLKSRPRYWHDKWSYTNLQATWNEVSSRQTHPHYSSPEYICKRVSNSTTNPREK